MRDPRSQPDAPMDSILSSDTFDGVTVVDLTRLLPGPFATMLLADLGARVIKVEPTGGGDYARWYPPQVDMSPGGYGAFFAALNRGKESVAVNLKTPAGRRYLHALLEKADVLVESFRPGVLARLGFDDDVLAEANPRLIVCSISSYGADGPLVDRAGHDIDFLARAGVLGLNGPADAVPGLPAVQIGDIPGGALYTAFGIAAALFGRERTGRGTRLDVSMTEGVLSLLGPVLNTAGVLGQSPPRGRDMLSGGLPSYRIYETADGRYFAVGALEPKFWAQVCQALGHPEWVGDGMATGADGEAADARIQGVFRSKTLDEWSEIFASLDACCEPVRTLDEVIDDAHFQARRAIRPVSPAGWIAVPPTSRGRDDLDRPVPLYGEHTRAIGEELGIDAALLDGANVPDE